MALPIKSVKNLPGGFNVGGEIKVFQETFEGWFYDTVIIENAGAAIAGGQEFELFRDLANKSLVDTNFKQQHRISRGKEFDLRTIQAVVHGRQADGGEVLALAYKFVLARLRLSLKVNGGEIANAPLEAFPGGMGPAGYSSETTTAVLSNGVPSLAAVRPLYKTIETTSDHDIEGQIRHDPATWITSYAAHTIATADGIPVRVYLGGKVKAGITRG